MEYSIKFVLISLIIIQITADEIPLKSYDELNTFKMIDQNESFIIKTNVTSKAYFDSFDKNSIIYISKNYEDFKSEKDQKITGKFLTIEADTIYYIRNYLYNTNYPSVFKTYLYPLEFDKNEINIKDQSFLYLEKNKRYTLNFGENEIKKMIKLSRKTLNSTIKIIKENEEEIELNQNELYYKIEDSNKLILEIEDNDAFIEFLSDTGDYEVVDDLGKLNFEVDKNILIIKIPKNPKHFDIQIKSDKEFSYSFSYGFSNLENYYYSSNSNLKIISKKGTDNYLVEFRLATPFKDINLIENEFLSFSVIIEKEKDQKITFSYRQTMYFMGDLYNEEMKESICKEILNNLTNVLEYYVYLDIAKNPPEIEGHPNYHHKGIDLQEELRKVSTKNRYFYEFYQEIERILTSVKDLHLKINAFKTPNGIPLDQKKFVLPFNFVIKEYNNTKRIFIKTNNYLSFYDENVQSFINSHLEIPLKYINDINPFEYIQNWSKYRRTKNIHAQFTFIINKITDFNLGEYPVDFSDIILNEYEFEDNKILRTNYILKPNMLESDSKGLKKEFKLKEEEIVHWDIFHEEDNGLIKCRVDNKNKVNVLVQTTFFLYDKIQEKVYGCASLFYSNNYPLVIIHSNNNGGSTRLAILMQQILQIRTTDRGLKSSFRLSDVSREYFESSYEIITDFKTCKVLNSFDDLDEIIDYYDYNDRKVEHKRTNIFDYHPRNFREYESNFREELKDSPNIKNPTDIIILTDSYSFSASSIFIQQFQISGGAIVVGYFGNPKIEGIDLFDSSTSYSSTVKLENTEIYKNLEELGFRINVLTTEEYFEDINQINPIPREYTFNPVDYRVNIYSSYSDDIYESFIKEAKEVHKKFNKENYCNPKNERLLLYDSQCNKIIDDKIVYGGYKCGNDGKWNKTQCEYYFCEIGYYFDHHLKQCVEECKYDENKKAFAIYQKDYDREFIIEKNMTYEFENYNNETTYFVFKVLEGQIESMPNISFLNIGNYFSINNDKNNNLRVGIKSIEPNINIAISSQIFDKILIYMNKGKRMYIIQCWEDSIFYIKNVLNNSNTSIMLAKYNNSMKYNDILEINKTFYKEYYGETLSLKKNELFFVYFDSEIFEQINIYFAPKRKDKEILDFSTSGKYILYLEKGKTYVLDGKYRSSSLMLKLDRETINSEIFIEEKNKTLNSDNLYLELNLDDLQSNQLHLEVKKENALIEILEMATDINIIDLKEYDLKNDTKLNLEKKHNFIRIPQNYSSKIINFRLDGDEDLIVTVEPTYTKAPYRFNDIINEETSKILENTFTFNITNHYIGNIKLMEDEYYYVVIQKLTQKLTVTLNFYDKPKEKDKDKKDSNSHKTLWIILISVSATILLIAIIFVIIRCKRNKASFDNLKEDINKVSFELGDKEDDKETTKQLLE